MVVSDPGAKAKTPSREVTKILHQQIKEHKAMIAERAKNEKELEAALAKIQKQLEESQNQSAELLQVHMYLQQGLGFTVIKCIYILNLT